MTDNEEVKGALPPTADTVPLLPTVDSGNQIEKRRVDAKALAAKALAEINARRRQRAAAAAKSSGLDLDSDAEDEAHLASLAMVGSTATANSGKTASETATNNPKRKRQTATTDDPTTKRQLLMTTFPYILMGMLTNPQNANIITFLSDEHRFIIVNPIQLETNLLPLYQKELEGTFTTQQFIRVLCNWGFEIKNDPKYPDINVYSHPNGFTKGDWQSCSKLEQKGSIHNVPEQPTIAMESTLLQKMNASRTTRRLSGIDSSLNNDHIVMRSFLQNQIVRRLSLPTPVPQSMLEKHKMKVQENTKPSSSSSDVEDNKDDSEKDVCKEDVHDVSTTMDANKIVTEAMAALSNRGVPKPNKGAPTRRHTMEEINTMTEQLLQRGMARRIGHRPLFGPLSYGSIQNNVLAEVEAQAKILYEQRRRASLKNNVNPMNKKGKKENSSVESEKCDDGKKEILLDEKIGERSARV
eukprot:scaffold69300_cov73-Cyclotella_meneghiniana.AAC.2